MSHDGGKHIRTWREIAEEASRETDPKKLEALAQELERAFKERDSKLRRQAEQSVLPNAEGTGA